MPFVIAIVFLVIFSVVFHLWSPWKLTDIASNWSAIDDTINITLWVTGLVFISVNLFMAYAVYKYRYNKNRRAKYEPENHKLENWLTGLTAVGVASMLTPGLFVWADFVNVPEEAHDVEVVGQQWQWSFRYPGEDGILGSADTVHITPDNPLGINPEDPSGQDDLVVTAQEMHLPVDQPVRLLLRSKDVLHDYSVAQFRVKMDMVPGEVTYLWLTPTATGRYEILCEELCGIGHHIMRGIVYVDSAKEYETWLGEQTTFAETQAQVAGNAEAGQANYAVCQACHGANGEGNEALNAPRIAGQEPWYLRTQLNYFRNGVRGSADDDTFGQQMAPMAATLATEEIMNNVIAYIQTLEAPPAPVTIEGDADRGRDLYENTCGVCHGADGQGIWSVNAPALSGLNDWYLVRELQNFKNGQRGVHSDDELGFQMISMVSALKDDEAIHDVVSYINSLR